MEQSVQAVICCAYFELLQKANGTFQRKPKIFSTGCKYRLAPCLRIRTKTSFLYMEGQVEKTTVILSKY